MVKLIALGVLAGFFGVVSLIGGLSFDPIVWEAVVIGAAAILVGPLMAWLRRNSSGVVTETADFLKDLLP